jgi:hypothetical protein
MNVKKAVKKVLALGIGSVMMGATVLSAMAADLSNFPAPFVQNGAYNAWIVVGQGAQVPDVIGAIDIGTRLQYEMRVPVSGSSGSAATVTVTGDAARVQTSTDILEFGEYLGEVKEVFTDSDLSALADGKISNNKGTFTYNQYIELSSTAGLRTRYVEDTDRDETSDYLYVNDAEQLYVYNLEFPTPIESDIDGNNKLDDLEDKSLTILGKTYTITTANVDAANDDVQLELMGGDVSDTLYEGETKTYTIGGKDYEVTVSYIGTVSSTTKVKFQIVYDGKTEVTSSLAASETYVLDDKTEVGVRDALEQNDYSGTQKDFVEFYMGANKMVLKDTDYTSTGAGGQSVEVGSESLSDLTVQIVADDSTSDELKINKIEVTAVSPDEIFIPAGGMLSDELDTDKKGVLFTQNFDFKYSGLTQPATEDVVFKTSGDTKYVLQFTTKSGEEIEMPLLNATKNNNGVVGADRGRLVSTEFAAGGKFNASILRYDYMLLGDASKAPDKRYTYLMRYKSYDADTRELQFENIGSGETVKYTLNAANETNILLGGKQFNVYVNATEAGSDHAPIWVDLDASGTANDIAMNATTKSGVWFQVPEALTETSTPGNVVFHVPTDQLDDDVTSDTITVVLDVEADAQYNVDLGTTITGVSLGQIGSSDSYKGYSPYGIFVEEERPTSSPDTVKLTIPLSQVESQAFVTSGAVQSTAVEGDTSGSSFSIAPIAVGAAKLDSEASGWKSRNVIAVGGPCANTVAAEMMGNPSPCGAGFEAGKAKIKLYENSGKVAMLVAGYSAEDTLRATRVVGNYKAYPNFKGMEVEVSGTSLTDITVSAPMN